MYFSCAKWQNGIIIKLLLIFLLVLFFLLLTEGQTDKSILYRPIKCKPVKFCNEFGYFDHESCCSFLVRRTFRPCLKRNAICPQSAIISSNHSVGGKFPVILNQSVIHLLCRIYPGVSCLGSSGLIDSAQDCTSIYL